MLQPRRCVLEEFPESDDFDCQYCHKGCSSNTSSIPTSSKKKCPCSSSHTPPYSDYTLDDSYLYEFCNDMTQIETECSCSKEALAMAYVKSQKFNNHSTYSLSAALCNGTLFPELTKPFIGGKCNDE